MEKPLTRGWKPVILLEAAVGIDPRTRGFSVRCSITFSSPR